MGQENQAAQDEKRARRKRKVRTIGCILLLLMSCVYCGIFLRIVWTGYLSWIGITVGTILLTPNILIAIADLAGKEVLKRWLSRAFAGLTIAILIVLGALAFWPERPGSWQPYSFDAELAALKAERAVLDEENAALRYEAALAEVNVEDRPKLGENEGDILRRLSRAPWRGQDQPEVAAWLDAQAPVIAQLRQIRRLEQCRWPVYTDSVSEWTVPYKKLEYAAQLLALTGNRQLGEGQRNEALETSSCLLRHAEHLYQQTHQLDYRIAFKAERSALQIIRHLLVQSELPPEEMQHIVQCLPNAEDNWNQDIARLLKFDEYRFAQYLAPVYEINEQSEIRFATSCPLFGEDEWDRKAFTRLGRLWRPYCYLNMPLNPQGVWVMARQESARMARFLEPRPMLRIPKDELYLEGSFFDVITKVLANGSRWLAQSVCFERFLYADFGEHYAAHLTQRRGTWLVLALRRYRDEHGAWPLSLEQASEYIPADAFRAPISGDHFVYMTNDADFRLYSKGINRLDEQGREGRNEALDRNEDDIAIWPPHIWEPSSAQGDHEMLKQLAEIYGEDYIKRLQADANDQ